MPFFAIRLATTVKDFRFDGPVSLESEARSLSYLRAVLRASLEDAKKE